VKKLINDPLDVMPQMLAGMARMDSHVDLLPGFNVLVRSDLDSFRAAGKVALISGGGSGHEPAHGGYVGGGMLTAAVVGDVFTSPGTDQVLAVIRAVTGDAGALLIVKNYTGDRLNFGLAAEIARAKGLKVTMVIVADDVALADQDDAAQNRGIAGTLFVHKLAGAAAESGASLDEVVRVAQAACRNLASMGVGLSACVTLINWPSAS